MDIRNYAIVTASYWGFTLTDGALRMLVLLHFHTLGYSPVQLAFLFLLYEFCGILTNLLGGWIGSRTGLKRTLFVGLFLQVVALTMLSFVQPAWQAMLSVSYVMAAQALSGIAKDLTKMSSKSAVKVLVPADGKDDRQLFKWVAILTGSKNALKGAGFLLGGFLLGSIGFAPALWSMAGALFVILVASLIWLKGDLGRSKHKVKFKQLFSKSREIDTLSAARFFLFGSRDIWFVVGLPIFLTEAFGWTSSGVGGFLAAWVIGYGFVQASAPGLIRRQGAKAAARSALTWVLALLVVTASIAAAIHFNFHPELAILGGLAVFGIVFAINSAVHSYLILAYTDADRVALNVGFYYMANACGRLVGTLLSGVMYLGGGLSACLWTSAGFVFMAAALTLLLPGIEPLISTETTFMNLEKSSMSVFERHLSLWVGLCILAGIGLGRVTPGLAETLDGMAIYVNDAPVVSIPIAICLFFMMYPIMVKIDFGEVVKASRNPRPVILTLFVNWAIKPFTMLAIATLFLGVFFKGLLPGTEILKDGTEVDLYRSYISGAILLGIAPCTAMVLVWSYLARGNQGHTLVMVAINSLTMLLLYGVLGGWLLGVNRMPVPWQALLLSVGVYVALPLVAGYWSRRWLLKAKGAEWFTEKFLRFLTPVSILALLATLILLFSFKGETILANPMAILWIAIPLTLQTLLIFALTYSVARWLKFSYEDAAPTALIGASNHFEVAIATAVMLFGLSSGAALATVVGVLIEVPLMLFLVRVCQRTRGWFPSDMPPHSRPRSD